MTTAANASASSSKRRVRVWFGEQTIMDRTFPPPVAERYEHAMRRRFVSLRITNDPADTSARPLPAGQSIEGCSEWLR